MKKGYTQTERERELLQAAGFTVLIKSPYHWHVRKAGEREFVNVWPTASKFMKDGGNGANFYTDVLKAVRGCFKNIADSRTPQDNERLAAQEEIFKMREQGLAYFQNYATRNN